LKVSFTTTIILLDFSFSLLSIICDNIGWLAIGWSTLDKDEFILVPLPAANIIVVNFFIGFFNENNE
jgi:hypothetical protein